MNYVYHLVNVFTCNGAVLSGNPLCVFEAADSLNTEQMQALARQFNLSETTFILASTVASARVRIFTPDFEMAFAGHPTLGTAHVQRMLMKVHGEATDSLMLEMQAGIIPVTARANEWTLTAKPAVHRELNCSREQLAAALGLNSEDVLWQPESIRPLWVNTGSEQLIVPLASAAAVRKVCASPQLLPRNANGRQLALVFAATGAHTVLARFVFEVGGAIREDPATGSACANLGGWYLATGHATPLRCAISQGEQVHRPSTLQLTIDADSRIFVTGEVVYLGRGELTL